MNYRHAFHAGNFADVLKHAVLCRILTYLCEKPAPFRVIDTHAGAGCYELAGPEASRTGEWRNGIERLRSAQLAEPVRALLAPYLDAIAALNPGGDLQRYPGSPMLAQALMRRHDRLIACEIEPHAAAALAGHLRGDHRTKAIAIDGWTALRAYVPPAERRGLVLVDPPFEQPGEFTRLAQGLASAHRKWPTGGYLIWYPIKEPAEVASFAGKLARLGIAKMLRVEVTVQPATEGALAGCGLIVVNPPWTLHDELRSLLPALVHALAPAGGGSHRLDWLARESLA